MLNAEFNKETFKNSVKENVKMLYRKKSGRGFPAGNLPGSLLRSKRRYY